MKKSITNLNYSQAVSELAISYIKNAKQDFLDNQKKYPNIKDFEFNFRGENIYEGEDEDQSRYYHIDVHFSAAETATKSLKKEGYVCRRVFNQVGSPSFFISTRSKISDSLIHIFFRSPSLFILSIALILTFGIHTIGTPQSFVLSTAISLVWIIIGDFFKMKSLQTEIYHSPKTNKLELRLRNPNPIRFYP